MVSFYKDIMVSVRQRQTDKLNGETERCSDVVIKMFGSIEEEVRDWFLENMILEQNFEYVNAWLKLCSLGCADSLN